MNKLSFLRVYMSYIQQCVICGANCSVSAKTCPSCGHPNPTKPVPSITSQIEGFFAKLVFIVIVVIAAIYFLRWLLFSARY